jgi:hypothetical protein
VNARTSDGSTPLHLAVAPEGTMSLQMALAHVSEQSAVTRVLIDAGADVNAVNNAGNRPLTIAYKLQNDEIQTLIRARGGTEATADRQLRMQREKHITRHYSIRTVQYTGERCDVFTLGLVCQRLAMRDADEIEVLSPREMRLTFYSGKTLKDERSPFRPTAEREKYTTLVRDRKVVEIQQNLQVVDEQESGCSLLAIQITGTPCWDNRGQACEKWGTHESEACDSRFAGFKILR